MEKHFTRLRKVLENAVNLNAKETELFTSGLQKTTTKIIFETIRTIPTATMW